MAVCSFNEDNTRASSSSPVYLRERPDCVLERQRDRRVDRVAGEKENKECSSQGI